MKQKKKTRFKWTVIITFVLLMAWAVWSTCYSINIADFHVRASSTSSAYMSKSSAMVLDLANPWIAQGKYDEYFNRLNATGAFKGQTLDRIDFMNELAKEMAAGHKEKYEKEHGRRLTQEENRDLAEKNTPLLVIEKLISLCETVQTAATKPISSGSELKKREKEVKSLCKKLDAALEEARLKLPE